MANLELENDPITMTIYEQVKDWAEGDEKLNASSIMELVTLLIPTIQRMVTGKNRGEYKKKVLITVLSLVIRDSKCSNDTKIILSNLVDTTIPTTIDIMIGVAHGNIDLKKTYDKVQNCVGCTIN